ncbi:MAG: substrate-binding domain-containing protein, partial [Draconibacterium sp.]|nr:substrate-binding domain-containing protein [Draconibacterium sp.]
GPEHLNISKNRVIGYLNGLNECGLEFDTDLLVHCTLSIEDAKLATQKLLQLKNLPDAIFGINDTVAFAAMIEVKKQKYKIPDDISLAGFTDEFHSIVVDPPLTSVSHPTFQMGEEAAKLFFESIEKGKNINKRIMLPIDLVVRESSLKK